MSSKHLADRTERSAPPLFAGEASRVSPAQQVRFGTWASLEVRHLGAAPWPSMPSNKPSPVSPSRTMLVAVSVCPHLIWIMMIRLNAYLRASSKMK